MNKPTYTPESIEVRVASMEEDCAEKIAEGGDLHMTATVLPEVRYLIERVKSIRKRTKTEPEAALGLIETSLQALERRYGAAVRMGKFVRIKAAIIADMRYLLDQLRIENSNEAREKIEVDEFDAAASAGVA
jgi:hypothetical protein